MAAWWRVAGMAELPLNTGMAVAVEGRAIALFRVGEGVCAIADACPHREAPLAGGELEGGVVCCPYHAWEIDLRTGAVLHDPDQRTPTYPCQVDGDDVWVEV